MDHKKKILIVEDEQSVLLAFRKALEKRFDIAVAHNGEEGIAMLQSVHPDLVLVDIIMPIKHGHDFLKEKKNLDEFHDVPVIVMTNVKSETEKAKAMEEGASAYFVKFETTLEDLNHQIDNVLG